MKYKIPAGLGNVEALIRRCGVAKKNFQMWRSLHQEAYDFAMPERETFRFYAQGQHKNRHVFDSTAIDGLEVFANKVQSGFFPDWLKWMEFQAGEEIPKDQQDDVNKQLEVVTDKFFGYFHQSNFSTEITPGLKDWGVGTGGIEVEEGVMGRNETLFKFTNIPLAEIYPERPASGAIKTSWREFDIEASNIKDTWPSADLPRTLEKMAKDKPLSMVRILNGHVFNPKDDMYYQIILYEKGKHIIFQQGFKTKRRIIFRSNVTPGETYGRGPIIRMLPDIRTLNKVRQFILENAAIQMAGVYTGVDDGVFNPYTVRIAPGSIIPVSSNNNQNPTMRALERAGDLGLGGIILDGLKEDIRRALLASPIGDIQDPTKTATEIMIRTQEALKRQNTAFGRLYNELIIPVVKACLDIGTGRGFLPEIVADGSEVKIKMVSPLAKQQDMEEFQNSQIWFQNVSQLDPNIMMGSVKVENLPKYWADKLSVPSMDLIRSDTERKQIADTAMQYAQTQLGGEGGEPV